MYRNTSMVGLKYQIKPTIMVLFMGTLKWPEMWANDTIGYASTPSKSLLPPTPGQSHAHLGAEVTALSMWQGVQIGLGGVEAEDDRWDHTLPPLACQAGGDHQVPAPRREWTTAGAPPAPNPHPYPSSSRPGEAITVCVSSTATTHLAAGLLLIP